MSSRKWSDTTSVADSYEDADSELVDSLDSLAALVDDLTAAVVALTAAVKELVPALTVATQSEVFSKTCQ